MGWILGCKYVPNMTALSFFQYASGARIAHNRKTFRPITNSNQPAPNKQLKSPIAAAKMASVTFLFFLGIL
jgi:hypothetical protein